MDNRIVEIRKNQGITQMELAKKAAISRPYLSAIERGQQSVISNVVMSKIASALNEPIADIFFAEYVVCTQQST